MRTPHHLQRSLPSFVEQVHRRPAWVVDCLLHEALGDSLLQVCHHAHERVRWCEPLWRSSTSLQRRPAMRASARRLCSRLCAAVRACEKPWFLAATPQWSKTLERYGLVVWCGVVWGGRGGRRGVVVVVQTLLFDMNVSPLHADALAPGWCGRTPGSQTPGVPTTLGLNVHLDGVRKHAEFLKQNSPSRTNRKPTRVDLRVRSPPARWKYAKFFQLPPLTDACTCN